MPRQDTGPRVSAQEFEGAFLDYDPPSPLRAAWMESGMGRVLTEFAAHDALEAAAAAPAPGSAFGLSPQPCSVVALPNRAGLYRSRPRFPWWADVEFWAVVFRMLQEEVRRG
jgi:hypothetical protein